MAARMKRVMGLTFDMRGPTRLAGAGPLDGRVRPHRANDRVDDGRPGLGLLLVNGRIVTDEQELVGHIPMDHGNSAAEQVDRG